MAVGQGVAAWPRSETAVSETPPATALRDLELHEGNWGHRSRRGAVWSLVGSVFCGPKNTLPISGQVAASP